MQESGIAIGRHAIGGGAPCYVIAEAGVNHNGDPDLAHELVDVAADAGADAVKFQTFDPDALVSTGARMAEYQIANTGADETQYAMLQKLTLPLEVFRALSDHAAHRGIQFLSTAFDEGSADFLEKLGIPAFKVPSGELTNYPFLAHLARKRQPLLISTGMGTEAEVERALGVVRVSGAPPVALFHCVSNYPAAPAECNLAAMATMRRRFCVPVGWSDHTEGLTISIAAVAHGAEILEKHFTLDRKLPGPDHAASLNPDELCALIAAVRDVEAARGDGLKRPTRSEAATASVVRRSLHARQALAAGHVLRAEDLILLRPGSGMPAAAIDNVVGRMLRRAVMKGEMIADEQFG